LPTAIHLVPQGTLSCLRQFTLYPRAPSLAYGNSPCTPGHPLLQRTFSSRGPSPPEDLLSPVGDSPCLACRRFTLSRLSAIHLVSPVGDSPCEYIPVRSTAASIGNCSCMALPSPIHGLVRPTFPQAYVDQLLYFLVTAKCHILQCNRYSCAIGFSVNRKSFSSLSKTGSFRRIHSRTIAACSFSSSLL